MPNTFFLIILDKNRCNLIMPRLMRYISNAFWSNRSVNQKHLSLLLFLPNSGDWISICPAWDPVQSSSIPPERDVKGCRVKRTHILNSITFETCLSKFAKVTRWLCWKSQNVSGGSGVTFVLAITACWLICLTVCINGWIQKSHFIKSQPWEDRISVCLGEMSFFDCTCRWGNSADGKDGTNVGRDISRQIGSELLL